LRDLLGVTALIRKSGECEPTVPRNIGGIPDSGISESRTLGIRFESADKESWRANEPDQVLLEPT